MAADSDLTYASSARTYSRELTLNADNMHEMVRYACNSAATCAVTLSVDFADADLSTRPGVGGILGVAWGYGYYNGAVDRDTVFSSAALGWVPVPGAGDRESMWQTRLDPQQINSSVAYLGLTLDPSLPLDIVGSLSFTLKLDTTIVQP